MNDVERLERQLEQEVAIRMRLERLLSEKDLELAAATEKIRAMQPGTPDRLHDLLCMAIEGIGDGVWEYDTSTQQPMYHTQYKKLLGYAELDRFALEEWRQVLHPEDKEKVDIAFQRYLQGKEPRFLAEVRLQCRDNVYRYFLIRGIAVEFDEAGTPLRLIGTLTDINAQKQLELELKDTANRLSALIGNLQAGILVETEDRRIVIVNELFCSMFGVEARPGDLTGGEYTLWGEKVKNLCKHWDVCVARVGELLAERKPVAGELVELIDGRILERDYIPVFIDDEYRGQLWKYTDVTEKIQAGKQLEIQRKFYEDVLNKIPAEIAVFNTSHQYLFLNPLSVRDPGVRQWLIGKTDEDYCRFRNKPAAQAQARKDVFDRVMATKSLVSWEEKLLSPEDEKPLYKLRNVAPVLNENGDVSLMIGYSIDITDRKQMEEQLKINEKRYRDLYNYSHALICTHDLQGNLLAVNPSITKLLGYTSEELLGKNLMTLIPRQDLAKFRPDYLDKVIHEGTAKGIFRILDKDGKLFFLLYQNYKVEEENTEPYIIGFSQDVTERIKTEKELRIAQRMTEELAKAKEQFLANISHEIRTPMNGILGVTTLLSKTDLCETQRKYVSVISESANNLLVIVNDILEIEKIASGNFTFENIPFIIADKVATVVQSFLYKAEEKQIRLQLQSELPGDLVVEGDPHRLVQILNNFLSNALKFTSKGKVTVGMRQVEQDDIGMVIEFTVADTGIGIPAERHAAIFTPFVQGASDIARKYGGTGLGLSICKSMIELQGGEVAVNSMEGKGSIFTFTIPYLRGTMMNQEEEKSPVQTNVGLLKGKRILVAEDVPVNQFFLRHILETEGAYVVVVNNGKDAVSHVQEDTYDLLLMDIQMPEMDGATATGIIRLMEDKRKADIPIVALTANALKGDNQRYLDAGMNDYIAKPYTADRLYAVIKALLQQQEMTPVKDDAAETSNGLLYDLSMMQAVSNGNTDFVRDIINLFLETIPEDLKALVAAGEVSAWNDIARIAHKLKSAVEHMGIHSLADTIRRLERVTDEHADLQQVPALIARVNDTMTAVFTQLKENSTN